MSSVGHIADQKIAEAIAHGHGVLHFGTSDDDALRPIIVGIGLMEDLVGTGKLKALDVLIARDGSIVVLEMHEASVAHKMIVVHLRTLTHQTLHPIAVVERYIGETLPHLSLLRGMNLLRLPWIDQIGSADDVAVGYHLSGLQLLLAQSRALVAVDIVVIIGSYLDEIERNLTQLEVAPPLLDKDFQPLGILAGRVSHVGTSLIEEDSLNGIVEDGRESAIAPDERTQIVVGKLFHAGHGVEALLGVFFQVVGIEPALHTCPALIGEDESNGNVESLVDGFGEKPACSRAVADGRGRYSIPVARSVVELWL